jgi:ligand-binding sensor domain-containing protein/class 3 adenylate cyclase/predicted metal-dependent HD superfamily phosphohydrolase
MNFRQTVLSFFFSLAMVLCFVLQFYGQPAKNIRFDYFSIKNGLSQSSINHIIQDHKGYMWFATQDGLNKYDGYNFTVYNHNPFDSTSLPNNYIHVLLEDSLGYIWVGTDNGLGRFDPFLQVFKTWRYNPENNNSLSDNIINSLCFDNEGILWIGTASGGLVSFNTETEDFIRYQHSFSDKSSITTNHIRAIIEDNYGNLWIGTSAGISILDKERKSFKILKHHFNTNGSLANDQVWSLFQDSNGRIWAGTNNGVSCFRGPMNESSSNIYFVNFYKGTGTNSISHNVVKTIYEDSEKNIWIGTDGGGLNKITFRNKNTHQLSDYRIYSYQENKEIAGSLCNNVVYAVFEDRSGSIWIGTNNGLNKFDPEKQSFGHIMHLLNNVNSLPESNVWSILEDRKGYLWVGTREGLSRINRQNNSFSHYKNISNSLNFQNNKSVLSILEDRNGNIWIGLVDGLFMANLTDDYSAIKEFKQINYNNTYYKTNIENRVYNLFQDSKGNIWAGTKYGLAKIDAQTGKSLFLQHNPGAYNSLTDNTIRSIFEDSKGNIWVGTEGGLNKTIYNSHDSVAFIHFRHENAKYNTLSSDKVLSIVEDKNGILWLGTYGGGLNRLNPVTGEIRQFTEKQGLANNSIYGILKDNNGNLWMSTNKGISVFNPYTEKFKNYEENDGLQSNEFNIGAYHKNKRGEMFFGGINGLNYFDPEDVKINTHPPQMVITNLYLFNKPVTLGENSVLKKHISYTPELVLNYKHDNFSIEFAALHYTFSEKNNYAYKLVGFDEEWNYVGTRRYAPYTNLDPGEYTFIVKGTNSDGVECDTAASMAIIIKPPFWATWWFRIAAILFIGGIIFGWSRYRIMQVEKQKVLLEELVKERTTEVIRQKEKIEMQNAQLELEKGKAENLLLNMLPQETVEELKIKGKATARHYRTVTVMFTDFKNFTHIAEKMRPRDLVEELDLHFGKFDSIIEKYNIEKIKTMGDAYMCAGGIPIRNKSNPIEVVLAGLEISKYIEDINRSKKEKGEITWEIRVGIHTGELIAGVIGRKRFAYDIWGDTVNIANRMEMSGESGRVNISGKTHMHVKEFFDCEHRGKIEAKNKGEIDMYFVNRISPDFALNNSLHEPNDMFWEYVNLRLYSSINYRKAEKYIISRLEQELSDDLFYHSIAHTKDVCHAVERIGKTEGIKGEDLFLLKTAALYHDAGFVKKYSNNEDVGVEMAKEALPRYGYSQEQIEVVSKLIMATRIPQKPTDKLEEIICDADLDYLGREDFHKIADKLKREFLANGVVKNDKNWDELQIKFLGNHKYFTSTSRKLRETIKQQHLAEIKKRFAEDNYG